MPAWPLEGLSPRRVTLNPASTATEKRCGFCWWLANTWIRNPCHRHWVAIDLEALGPAVRDRAAVWVRLGVIWEIQPVAPNHGKAVVEARFESPAWMGDLMLWVTGEAELATVRRADGRIVNKHYDLLVPNDLNTILDELVALLSDASTPESAVTA
jgi:hypothetical protein